MVNRNYLLVSLITIFISQFISVTARAKFVGLLPNDAPQEIIQQGIDEFSRVSSPLDNIIINKININLIDHPDHNVVRTYQRKGRLIIEISSGFSFLVESLAIAYAIEQHLNINGYGVDFTKHMFETYETDKLIPVKSPFTFGDIPATDLERLGRDEIFGLNVHKFYLIYMWYTLAHEVGHQVLKHEKKSAKSLKQQREYEREADTWANKVFIKLGIPPASGFPILYYWYFYDQFSVKNELSRTHPSELNRFKEMLESTIDNFEEWSANSAIPKDQLEDMLHSSYKALKLVKNDISKQLNFDSSILSSELFKKCDGGLKQYCIEACVEQSHLLKMCEEKVCVSKLEVNVRKLDCFEIASEFIERRNEIKLIN